MLYETDTYLNVSCRYYIGEKVVQTLLCRWHKHHPCF